MTVPLFVEFEPADDCPCAGCAQERRTLAHSRLRDGGHPAAHGARRALVLAAAAGTVLATPAADGLTADALPDAGPTTRPAVDAGPATRPAVDAEPATAPQGQVSGLYGGTGSGRARPVAELRHTTRAEIIARAKTWIAARVPYNMNGHWSDGYRADCSGFVSMAWGLGSSQWTGSLGRYAVRITKDELAPGDILLYHNTTNPSVGSHVTIFGGWANAAHTKYVAYELAPGHARKRVTPYAYWSNATKYVPYRYRGLTGGGLPDTGLPEGVPGAFPGLAHFGPGADNSWVTRLGKLLVARGGSGFYRSGPGPRWTVADRDATRAFQRAQGWRGAAADGIPGPDTWAYLIGGKGRDIRGAAAGTESGGFPGARHFRPGAAGTHVTQLGRQLVKKGYGEHYLSGPGPRWTEADRRNVEAFQRAQGWRGREADGYPGPETWRRLFR
ncbi:peptidoglycan-binding protein [Streptomyces niger]|uniref:peptidoglycan-binding protein n=1 Tax=Streptomyces niger TaxID=66373 RepID=UPI0006995D79|nr:peptidoglycan-binding protein [Streptomyces niger]